MRLSQHRFPNLGELYYGDLAGKVRKDVRSLDFTHKKTCNCSKNIGNEPGVKCAMGGGGVFYILLYIRQPAEGRENIILEVPTATLKSG